jgi:hypothetical protein
MENEQKSLENMSNNELLEIVWQSLNKATMKGVFNINEAYLLKLVHNKLVDKLTSLSPSN